MAVSDIITAIDTKIAAIITDPNAYTDYKIGDKSVNWSRYLNWLKDVRKELLEKPDSEIMGLEFENFNINEFGVTK